MNRDKLLGHLIKLPPDADVVLQFGDTVMEIIGVQTDGSLLPHPGDLCDALYELGLPASAAKAVTDPQRPPADRPDIGWRSAEVAALD